MDMTALDPFARMLHIAGVMIWIGHNWVNVVNMPRFRGVLPDDPPEAARQVFIAASKREHGIFRHASLVVLLTGLYLLWRRGDVAEAFMLSGHSAVIGLGAWLGTLMVLNLWFVLWPHQKKVLGFVDAPIAERLRCARITFVSSRINTVLSLATLMLMVLGAHGA
jgi:Urate oxidase N-terminal